MNIRRVVSVVFLAAMAVLLVQAETWLICAVIASALVGIMVAGDAFLFKEDIYKNWMQPLVITGVMGLLPWVLAPFVIKSIPGNDIIALALLTGVLYMSGFVFYFKAIYLDQDAVVITVMLSLCIAVVPVIAYFTIGEEFSTVQYIGVAFLLIGAILASWKKTKARAIIVGLMVASVILISSSVVLMKEVFNLIVIREEGTFWSVFIIGTLGEAFVSLVVFIVIMNREEKVGLAKLIKSYWPAFLLMEGGQMTANATSSFAISIGTASLVTATDGLSSAFVIIFSMMAVEIFKSSKFVKTIEKLEENFLDRFWWKVLGIAAVVVGAYQVG